MTKNQQVLLGVAAVGIVGYLYWKSKQPKAAFVTANASGKMNMAGKMANVAGKKMNAQGVQSLAKPVAPVGSNANFKPFTATPIQDSGLTKSADGGKKNASGIFNVHSTNW